MTEFVLDACCIIAVLRREPGYEYVLEHAPGSVISSVNMAEVLALADSYSGSRRLLNSLVHVMRLREMPFDRPQAELVAEIYPRTLGSTIGLADRACLALARHMRLPVLTSDRSWLKHDTGAEVQLFRHRVSA